MIRRAAGVTLLALFAVSIVSAVKVGVVPLSTLLLFWVPYVLFVAWVQRVVRRSQGE